MRFFHFNVKKTMLLMVPSLNANREDFQSDVKNRGALWIR